MNSIFVLNKTNFDFFKKNPDEACEAIIGKDPYWKIKKRICYHFGEDPKFIIHNGVVLDGSYKKKYDDQLIVLNEKMKYISELIQNIAEKNIS